jgi:hypothetical protein
MPFRATSRPWKVAGCPAFTGARPRFEGFLHAEVIETLALRLQVTGDIPKTFPTGHLSVQHSQKLTPTVAETELLSRMMYLGKSIELISRYKCNQLLLHGIAIEYGSDPIGFYDLFRKVILPQRALRISIY